MMNYDSGNIKPVEFYPIERMTIKIDEEKVIWRKLTIEINSKLGEHMIEIGRASCRERV